MSGSTSCSGSLQTDAAVYDAFSPVPRAAAAINATDVAACAASAAAAAAAGFAPWSCRQGAASRVQGIPAGRGRPLCAAVTPSPCADTTPDVVARLLRAANVRRPEPPSKPPPPPPASDFVKVRDRCVLDAASGQGSWSLRVLQAEVEQAEREEGMHGRWVASVSVICRLSWPVAAEAGMAGERAHRLVTHDETGSGHDRAADGEGGKPEAIKRAGRKAVASAAHRLARRFAGECSKTEWAEIEAQVRSAARGGGGGGYPGGGRGGVEVDQARAGHGLAGDREAAAVVVVPNCSGGGWSGGGSGHQEGEGRGGRVGDSGLGNGSRPIESRGFDAPESAAVPVMVD